jgi:hypothetical protein
VIQNLITFHRWPLAINFQFGNSLQRQFANGLNRKMPNTQNGPQRGLWQLTFAIQEEINRAISRKEEHAR